MNVCITVYVCLFNPASGCHVLIKPVCKETWWWAHPCAKGHHYHV